MNEGRLGGCPSSGGLEIALRWRSRLQSTRTEKATGYTGRVPPLSRGIRVRVLQTADNCRQTAHDGRRAQEKEGGRDGETVSICISMASMVSRSQPVIWPDRSSASIRLLGKLYLFRNKPPQQGHACHGC